MDVCMCSRPQAVRHVLVAKWAAYLGSVYYQCLVRASCIDRRMWYIGLHGYENALVCDFFTQFLLIEDGYLDSLLLLFLAMLENARVCFFTRRYISAVTSRRLKLAEMHATLANLHLTTSSCSIRRVCFAETSTSIGYCQHPPAEFWSSFRETNSVVYDIQLDPGRER